MEVSIFLAKLIGIYMLVMAFDLLIRKHELEGAIKDFSTSKGLLAFSGSLSLLFGLAIVIAHPIFTIDWRGLISLIGCLLIIRGFLRFAFPSHTQKTVNAFFHHWYWVILLVLIVIGAFLTYCGFVAT